MTKQEIANHFFARNPKLTEVHVSSDGQGFYEKHQAEAHAGRLKDKEVASFDKEPKVDIKKLEVTDPATVDFLEGNVSKVSEVVKTIKTPEELDALLAREVAGADRKGVKEAIEARRTELTESNSQNPE